MRKARKLMVCAYCLQRKPWDIISFPTIYAKCRACIDRSVSPHPTSVAEG